MAVQNGDTVLFEQFLALILVDVHGVRPIRAGGLREPSKLLGVLLQTPAPGKNPCCDAANRKLASLYRRHRLFFMPAPPPLLYGGAADSRPRAC
jgi:hypothetical protein